MGLFTPVSNLLVSGCVKTHFQKSIQLVYPMRPQVVFLGVVRETITIAITFDFYTARFPVQYGVDPFDPGFVRKMHSRRTRLRFECSRGLYVLQLDFFLRPSTPRHGDSVTGAVKAPERPYDLRRRCLRTPWFVRNGFGLVCTVRLEQKVPPGRRPILAKLRREKLC